MGKREFIARNVAAMFHDGDVVNLGVGIPTLASTYVPEGMTVLFHAENGCVGAGEAGGFPWDFSTRESVIAWMDSCAGEKGSWKTVHKDLCNASGEVITLIPGACCFDSTMAFAIARGGHLDATVLGALQVDEACNLANWKIPGKTAWAAQWTSSAAPKRSSSPWNTARKMGMRRSWNTARCRLRRPAV